MAESKIMDNYYPAMHNFNSNLLKINNITDKKLISFWIMSNQWLVGSNASF